MYVFAGIEGTHLKPIRAGNSGSVVIQVDPTLDPSLKELLQRITPLCQYYSTVVQFCEEQAQQGREFCSCSLSGMKLYSKRLDGTRNSHN
jgi:hypothetical protein